MTPEFSSTQTEILHRDTPVRAQRFMNIIAVIRWTDPVRPSTSCLSWQCSRSHLLVPSCRPETRTPGCSERGGRVGLKEAKGEDKRWRGSVLTGSFGNLFSPSWPSNLSVLLCWSARMLGPHSLPADLSGSAGGRSGRAELLQKKQTHTSFYTAGKTVSTSK